MKKITMLIVLHLMTVCGMANAGLITRPYNYVPGNPILSGQVNSNENALYNLVNGSIDNANIAAGAGILCTKLTISGGACANTVQDTSLYGTSWSDLTDGLDTTLHIHYADTLLMRNASGTFATSTTIEDALDALAAFTGYTAAATATTTPMQYVGFATGSGSVTVAPNTAPAGILVAFGAHVAVSIAAGNNCAVYAPIAVNSVDLSSSGSPDVRYHVMNQIGGSADFFQNGNYYSTSLYAVVDGWDPTISNVIDFGTVWSAGGCLAGSTADSGSITVYALK